MPLTRIGCDGPARLALNARPFGPIYGSVAVRWQVRVSLGQMNAGTAAGRLRIGLFSLGVLPTSCFGRNRLGPVGLVTATGVGRVSGSLGLGSGRCTPFAMGRVRLIAGRRELVPKELALSWRKLALRGASKWCAAARHRLGLISFDWGTTRATAPIREGLISLRAARGLARCLFRFNLRWPSALVLLRKRA